VQSAYTEIGSFWCIRCFGQQEVGMLTYHLCMITLFSPHII